MIITLFGDTIVKAGKEEEEARLSDKLDPILRSMPGFISFKSYHADDGEEIGVIRFESRETLDGWVHQGVHGSAQRVADQFYERFWVQSAETFREYTWDNGTKVEGDLASLFLER